MKFFIKHPHSEVWQRRQGASLSRNALDVEVWNICVHYAKLKPIAKPIENPKIIKKNTSFLSNSFARKLAMSLKLIPIDR